MHVYACVYTCVYTHAYAWSSTFPSLSSHCEAIHSCVYAWTDLGDEKVSTRRVADGNLQIEAGPSAIAVGILRDLANRKNDPAGLRGYLVASTPCCTATPQHSKSATAAAMRSQPYLSAIEASASLRSPLRRRCDCWRPHQSSSRQAFFLPSVPTANAEGEGRTQGLASEMSSMRRVVRYPSDRPQALGVRCQHAPRFPIKESSVRRVYIASSSARVSSVVAKNASLGRSRCATATDHDKSPSPSLSTRMHAGVCAGMRAGMCAGMCIDVYTTNRRWWACVCTLPHTYMRRKASQAHVTERHPPHAAGHMSVHMSKTHLYTYRNTCLYTHVYTHVYTRAYTSVETAPASRGLNVGPTVSSSPGGPQY